MTSRTSCKRSPKTKDAINAILVFVQNMMSRSKYINVIYVMNILDVQNVEEIQIDIDGVFFVINIFVEFVIIWSINVLDVV